MKRQLLFITVIWFIALMCVLLVTIKNNDNDDSIYKITINRIHNRLTDDFELNENIVNNLSKDEQSIVNNIEIIAIDNITYLEINRFFETNSNDKVVFKPIEGSDFIVKYYIVDENPNSYLQLIILIMIITCAYIFLIIYVLMLHRNVIKPMRRISDITKQLARGYLEEINLQYKSRLFKDFVWALDMLREQLSYERNKNFLLEKKRKTLVASLSHDIRTPLSSVKNYTIALKEDVYDGKEEIHKALSIILEKVEVIEKLTKELLDSSLKEVSQIEVNPQEIYMFEIHNRLNRMIHQKTDLLHMNYIETRPDVNLLVLVDLDRLQEVFDNIIENAIKYGDLKNIRTNYAIEENYQLIEINNTGSLIPKSEMKYIFNSYYRGSNVKDKPGCGLGLYISKQIMKNMHGDIYVKNTEDGVSFVVVIKQAG